MGYSAEIVRRARARLAADQEDRQSQTRQRLSEVYGEIPRVKEIDLQLRRSMAQAAQAAFTQGGDAQTIMLQVKEQNLGLQKERQALIAERFGEGYLDERPVCEICGGSGYLGARMCRCLQEYCRREQKKELAVLSGDNDSFSQFRLDYYSDGFDSRFQASPRKIMERVLEICRAYAMFFTPGQGNLLFSGETGLGKTYLSACIARAVAERGCGVVYESAGRLFSNLEQARFAPTEENRALARSYSDCDLLIIDDLGTEMLSQFVTAAFYSLLNERLMAGKSMIISTNFNMEELSKRYTPQIASRLQGEFQLLRFVGEDIRVRRNRGKL